MDDNKRMLVAVGLSTLTIIAIALLFFLESEYFIMSVILVVVTVPIMLLGAYMMLTGKGSSLISGFNTSPAHVRAAYDKAALSRFTGLFIWVICLVMLFVVEAFIFFESAWVIVIAVVIIIASLVWAFVLARGDAFKKDPSVSIPAPTAEERKKYKKVLAVASVASLLVVASVVVVLFSYGSVSADLEDDELVIKAPMIDETVTYSDISPSNVSLVEDLDRGMRVSGFGTSKIKSGTFKNDQFGMYKLASYANVKTFIVIEKPDGSHLVFNLDSAEKTSKLYDDLLIKITP